MNLLVVEVGLIVQYLNFMLIAKRTPVLTQRVARIGS